MGLQPAAPFYIAAYYALAAGAPPLKPEMVNARVKVDRKKSGLEVLLKTPHIGDFDISFIRNAAGPRKYTLDNFDFNTPSGSVNVYSNTSPVSSPASPPPTPSPFSWKLIVQNDRVFLSLAHTLLGKLNLYLAPDTATGDTVIKRASAFTAGGAQLFTYRR